jgi:uncharacterized protein RhaS with RHS repeats
MLKYSSTPQLQYGQQTSAVDRLIRKVPQGAQPIATAPQASAMPVQIIDADGKMNWCLHHRDGWRKLEPEKDSKTGAVQWRMNGEQVRQPVAWLPRKQ